MPEFSRRRFVGGALGGAAAACALTRVPATAEAAVLPSRSGLAWASGVHDNYPRAGEREGSRR